MNLDYVKIPFTNNPSMTRYDGPIYNKTPNKTVVQPIILSDLKLF